MKTADVVIATITLARTRTEEQTLLASLEKLAALGLPLVIADGGSTPRFRKALRNSAFCAVSPGEKGLVQQVKAALDTALRQFPDKPAILYTEPDKYPFFEKQLTPFIARARASEPFGVVAAARNAKSFGTFPAGQQRTESFMNEAFSWIIGRKGDYCYGPLLLSRRAAEIALDAPNDLGWGWRFWTMQKAHAAGLRVQTVELDVPCPKEQRGEDSISDRMYRLKQLRQNLAALSPPSWSDIMGEVWAAQKKVRKSDRVPNSVLEERKRRRR
jgi:hypothetical protein